MITTLNVCYFELKTVKNNKKFGHIMIGISTIETVPVIRILGVLIDRNSPEKKKDHTLK